MTSFTHFPNGAASYGMPILGASGITTTGNVFYVDSGSSKGGDTPDKGSSPDKPFLTLDFAIGRCTANNGDVIIAMPGHAETLAAANALAIDVDGISIIGLGHGSARPTLTVNIANAIDVTGTNCFMQNFLITTGVDNVNGAFIIDGDDFHFDNWEFQDGVGQVGNFFNIESGGGSADRLHLSNFTYRGAAAAGTNRVMIFNQPTQDVVIEDFWIDGNFAVAAIGSSSNPINLIIRGNKRPSYIRTRNAADIAITMGSTASGFVGPNLYIRLADDAANITEAVAGADLNFIQPIAICNADGEVALNTNITASTDA